MSEWSNILSHILYKPSSVAVRSLDFLAYFTFFYPSSPLSQAQRCVSELKSQVMHLEAEVEEQRTHKQMAIVENEHLRMEVDALRCANVASVGAQIGLKEADSEFTDLWPG